MAKSLLRTLADNTDLIKYVYMYILNKYTRVVDLGMSVCSSVRLSVRPLIRPPICPPVCQSGRLPVRMSIDPSAVPPPACPSVCLFVCPSVCLSIGPSVLMSTR